MRCEIGMQRNKNLKGRNNEYRRNMPATKRMEIDILERKLSLKSGIPTRTMKLQMVRHDTWQQTNFD